MSPMLQGTLWREGAGADGDSEDGILKGLAALDADDNSAAAAVAAAEAAAADEDEEEEPTTNTFILIRHGRNKPKHLKLAALLSALGMLWTAAKVGRLVEIHRAAKATQSASSTKELQHFEALAAVLQQQLQHQQAGAAEAPAEALEQLQQLQQVQQDTHELLRQRQQNLKAQALAPVEGPEDPEALAARLQQSMQQRDASTFEVDVHSNLTGLTEETVREMLQQLQQTDAKLTEEEEHADLEVQRFKAAAPILEELQQQLQEAREEVGQLEAASSKRETLLAASDELDEQQQQLLLVQQQLQQQLEEREKRRLARQQQLEAKRTALLKEREDVVNQLSLLKEKHSALKAAACNEELQKELEEEHQLQQRQQQLQLLQQSLQRLLQRDSPAKDAALQQQLGSEAAAVVQQLRPEVQELLEAQIQLRQQKLYRGRVAEAERTVQQQQRQLDRLRATLKERMSFPGSFGAARHIQLSVQMKIWESLLNKTADQQQEEWYRAQRRKTLMRQRLTASSGTVTHLAALQAACKDILAVRGGIAEARREQNRLHMVEELQQLGIEALLEEAAAGSESAVVQQIAESMWQQQQNHAAALKQLQEHSEQQVMELLQQMHTAEKPSSSGAPLALFYQVAGLIKEASKQQHYLKELELLHGRSRSQLVPQTQDLLLLALETARTRSSSSSLEEGEEEALKAMSRAHVDALDKEEQKQIMWETFMEQLEERYSTDLLQQTAADRSKKNKQKAIIREATKQLQQRKPLVLTTSTKPGKEIALQNLNNTKTQQQKQLLPQQKQRQQKQRQQKQRQQQQRPRLGGDRPRSLPASSKVLLPTFKVSPPQSVPLSHWETGSREAGWKGWIPVEAGPKEAAKASMMMETAEQESTTAAGETDSEETESRQTGLRKTGMGETGSASSLPSMLTLGPAPAMVAAAREAARETEEETAQETAGKEATKETTTDAPKTAIEREAAEETAGQSAKEATEETAGEIGEVMLKVPSLPIPPTSRARWGRPASPLEALLGVAGARGDLEDEETTEEWREASDERETVQEEDTTKEEGIAPNYDTTEEETTETGDEGKTPTPAVPLSMQLMIELLEGDEGSNPQQETSVPSTPPGSPPSSPTGSSWESHLVPFGLNMKELYDMTNQQQPKAQNRQTRARTRSRSGPGSRPRSGSGPGSQWGLESGTGSGASSESGSGPPSGSLSDSSPASRSGVSLLRRSRSLTALNVPSTVHMRSSSRSPSRYPSRHSVSRSSSPSSSASSSMESSKSSVAAAAGPSPPASSSYSSSSSSSASPSNSSPRFSSRIIATPSAAPHTQSPQARRRNSFTTTQSLQQLQQQQQQPQSPRTSRRQPQAKAAPPTGRHSNSRWRP